MTPSAVRTQTTSMNPFPNETLDYSQQPSGSLAICEFGPDGSVRVQVPPPLHRRVFKVVLGAEILAAAAGAALVALVSRDGHPALYGLALVLSWVGLVTSSMTLWMGLRWTIIEAGRDGLRLKLRGPIQRREHFVPRDQIAQLLKRTSLLVLDARGQLIIKIDVTTPAEERWLMALLNHALRLPPPIPMIPPM